MTDLRPFTAEQIVTMGWRDPDGIHNQPPYVAWQLTADPDRPWGIKSRSGVNCLGALIAFQGQAFTDRKTAEAIVAELSKREL